MLLLACKKAPLIVVASKIPKAPFAGCKYKTTLTTVTNEDQSTWNNVDIGEEHPDRVVVLAIYEGVAVAPSDAAVSTNVNGQQMIQRARNNEFGVFSFPVPTGTLVTVQVAFVGSQRKAVGVYVAYPWTPLSLDLGSASANTTSNATVSDQQVEAGGCLIYSGGQHGQTGDFVTTWTGVDAVTEDADAQLEATATYTHGHINVTRASSADDLTLAESASGTKRLVVMTLPPPRYWQPGDAFG